MVSNLPEVSYTLCSLLHCPDINTSESNIFNGPLEVVCNFELYHSLLGRSVSRSQRWKIESFTFVGWPFAPLSLFFLTFSMSANQQIVEFTSMIDRPVDCCFITQLGMWQQMHVIAYGVSISGWQHLLRMPSDYHITWSWSWSIMFYNHL